MKRYYIIVLTLLANITYTYEEKPIVVIIPSYNNAKLYEWNLDSVCFQNYSNYRIVYIDDCSPDGTGNLVRAYIDKHDLQHKVTLLRNEINRGALYNLYNVIHRCEDDEIIVTVDGDDKLAHNNVLKRVNQEYQNPDVWMTYGQHESYPHGKRGFCKPIRQAIVQKHAYRELDWVTSHLRTFYAGLFKQIKLKDLLYENELFRVTWDMAFLFPMLEMAHGKWSFITDVLYVYNEDTPLSDCKLRVVKQLRCDKVIRAKEKYAPIANYKTKYDDAPIVDVVIFSSNPQALENVLTQMQKQEMLINDLTVLMEKEREHEYKDIRGSFNTVDFISFGQDGSLAESIDVICSTSGYLLWTTDQVSIAGSIPLQDAMQALKHTHAISCNFALGKNVQSASCLKREMKQPPFASIPFDFCSWRLADGEFGWRNPFACTMTLFKKSDLLKVLKGADYNTLQELESVLVRSCVDLEQIGLCPQEAIVKPTQEMRSFLATLMRAGYTMSGNSLVKV